MLNGSMLAASQIMPPEERANIEEKNAAMARQLKIAVHTMKETQLQCRQALSGESSVGWTFRDELDDVGKKLAEALHLMGVI